MPILIFGQGVCVRKMYIYVHTYMHTSKYQMIHQMKINKIHTCKVFYFDREKKTKGNTQL